MSLWTCAALVTTLLLTLLSTSLYAQPNNKYLVSVAGGVGRRFDGVGGLSGGGCSTRLLADYDAVYRNQIMDFLYTPGFGAALQILKVEIGGDAQSTDGTEPSHMHTADDENYNRGYEWTAMLEAKRRNPNVILYGLSWGFPGWVGEGTRLPWTNSTIRYTLNWILGAKLVYGLDIDYIGIWNERSWDKQYTIALRAALDANGLKTKIVGHDNGWDVCDDLSKDAEWAAAVDVISAHYPASGIKDNCIPLNKVQWASEDMAVSWDTGAQCWARELNQNYVRANLTSTIAWDLINSFYDSLEFAGAGLLRAVQPWSNYYQIGQVIWAAAHTTQFTAIGWTYLQHGSGVGLLANGGSYVTLTDPFREQVTIIVESMNRDSSQCRFSSSVEYTTSNQTVTFQLDSSFSSTITQLNWFYSDLNTIDVNKAFIYGGVVTLQNGAFSFNLPVGFLHTFSTLNGTKGAYAPPPPSTPFPLPYADDFEQYAVDQEAANFADQTGSWQIVQSGSVHGKVMRQMVTEVPISWCGEALYPFSIIGDVNWKLPFELSVDVLIETANAIAFIALGVSHGSCDVAGSGSPATVLSLNGQTQSWQISNKTDLKHAFASDKVAAQTGFWYNLKLRTFPSVSVAYIDDILVGQTTLLTSQTTNGWAAIGSSWDYVQFDNFRLSQIQMDDDSTSKRHTAQQ